MNNTITLQKSQLRNVIDFIGSLMEAIDVDDPTEFNEGYDAFVEPLVKIAYEDNNTDAGQCEALDRLKVLIEKKYGTIDDERGCYVNGQWLSVADIVALIEEVNKVA